MKKRMYRAARSAAAAALALACALLGTLRAFSEEAEPELSAYSACLYCANNGEFMVKKNSGERLPMASTTKILTALLGIEADEENGGETAVTITPEMYAEGSSMYLAAGETVTMRDLVGGMLMVSGNDAANAIAMTVAGSREEFARLMNARAAELGLRQTHFVTPSGLDADGHFTTAEELALLMAHCMENETFARLEQSRSVTVNFIEPQGKTETYYNENKLLSRCDYCVGGKTGFTDKAGRTLVSCAEKDGVRLIAVTLNDPDDWNDHTALFDYGFDRCTMKRPEAGGSYSAAVVGGERESVALEAGEPPLICTGSGSALDLSVECEVPHFVYAPVEKGERVGWLRYYTGGVYAGRAELTAAEGVEASCGETAFTENTASFFRALFRRLRKR